MTARTSLSSRLDALEDLAARVDDYLALAADGNAELSPATTELLHRELEVLTATKRRVEAHICRAIAQLHRVEADKAVAREPGDPQARTRALRDVKRELQEDLGMTGSQVAAAKAVGQRLQDSPELARAMDTGNLTPAHARALDRTVAGLEPADRARLEPELIAAAAKGMPTDQFGRLCRRRLAEVDRRAAEAAEHRRHLRRHAATANTLDGMTALHGEWAGLQGEIVHTAINAFRRHDVEGEHRTPQQRTADAVVDALQAALDAGRAPSRHGVRPHIVVTVDTDTLIEADDSPGACEGAWTGPMVWSRVRRILDDSSVSFLQIGEGLPLRVTREVRTVPVGLHRGIVHRDRGCIHVNCDMPAAWCQVMHLDEAYAKGGRLSRTNAALGCHQHHRAYDAGELELRWHDGRPTLHPPDT